MLNTATILIIYLCNFFLRNYQRVIVKNIDEMNITPGDFAVMVGHLPYDKNKDDIKEWINSIVSNVEVIQINLAYDISEVVSKLRKLDKFNTIKTNIHQHKNKHNIDEVNDTIDKLEAEIQTCKEK